MASTNKTTNYQLSQFLGTDKPAWLGDYNQDMMKIDGAMKANADAATAAAGKGDAAQATADAASSAAETAQQTAETAQESANQTNIVANTANDKADVISRYLNLNVIENLTWTSNYGQVANATTKIVKNADGTLCKIYGTIDVTGYGSNSVILTSSDTGLRPDAPITIAGSCLRVLTNATSGAFVLTGFPTFTINTDGTITTPSMYTQSGSRMVVSFINSLLMLKDFGDVINP